MYTRPIPDAEDHRVEICGPNSSTWEDGNNGTFEFPFTFVFDNKKGKKRTSLLICIISDKEEWDHVLVKAMDPDGRSRLATWEEMCFAKKTFFKPEENVMQLHFQDKHIMGHLEGVLHLWKPQGKNFPLPRNFHF